MIRRLVFVVASVALACIGATHAAFSQPIHLRYGQAYSAQRSIFALPMLLAERQGFFLREGLDFHMVPVPGGGTKMIDALHDGTAHISHVATPFLVQAALKGSDAVAVVTEFNNPIYSLVVKPEIKTYADLKGKLIGLAAETGSITISIRKLLAMNGIDRDDFRSALRRRHARPPGLPDQGRLRCGAARPAAGFRGDAARLSPARAVHRSGAGIRLHGHGGAPLLGAPRTRKRWCATRAPWRRRSPSSAIPRTARTVIKTIADTTGFAEANARLTLSLYFEPEQHVLPMRGEIGMKGMETAISFLGEAGVIKPPLPPAERFVDLQYLRAAGLQD